MKKRLLAGGRVRPPSARLHIYLPISIPEGLQVVQINFSDGTRGYLSYQPLQDADLRGLSLEQWHLEKPRTVPRSTEPFLGAADVRFRDHLWKEISST